MSQQSELMRGNLPVGGKQPLRPNRRFEILAKDFISVEQTAPLRVLCGQGRVSGTQVVPIFGFRNEAVTTEAGK